VEPGRPPRPVELDLVFRTERGTPVNPNHASRAFARLAASVGLAGHPHLLRHALASAMAANKEPASIIAAQLRHADGGALAQRVYIHQLPPDRAPAGWGDRGRVRPSSAGWAGVVGSASGGGKPEGNPTPEPDLIGRPVTALLLVGAVVAGTGFEPV
jgi:Phage integrase family